jgi:hypothetical protein
MVDKMRLNALLTNLKSKIDSNKRRIGTFDLATQTLAKTHLANEGLASALNSQFQHLTDTLALASHMAGVHSLQFGGFEHLSSGTDMAGKMVAALAQAHSEQSQLARGLAQLAAQNPHSIRSLAAEMKTIAVSMEQSGAPLPEAK